MTTNITGRVARRSTVLPSQWEPFWPVLAEVVAEREGIRKIFTVDRDDFNVYRLHGAIRPRIIP